MELFSLPLMFAEGPGHSTNPVPPMFGILAILTTLSALFSYFNHKVLKLPTTIGLMLIALVFSLVLLGIGQFYPHMEEQAKQLFKEGQEQAGYSDDLEEGFRYQELGSTRKSRQPQMLV